MKIGERRADGLDSFKTAIVGRREEFEGCETLGNRRHRLGRGDDAGKIEHIVLGAAIGDFGREAGRNYELRARYYRLFALVAVDYRAGADERLRIVFGCEGYRLGGALGAEGYFSAGQSAVYQSFHFGEHFLYVVENYYGYDLHLFDEVEFLFVVHYFFQPPENQFILTLTV